MQPEKLDMRGVGTAEVLDTIADNDDAGPARNARPNGKPPRGRRAVPLPAAAPSVAPIAAADRDKALRIVEALLFAAPEPLDEAFLGRHLPAGADTRALLDELKAFYSGRGVNLVRVAGKWAFRTASDLAYLLERHAVEERKLSKAALETLAIVAYHQPVTRAEIEEIRGVETSKGTLDILLETGWVRLRGRRRAPGKPLTFGTTER
ncbi:MAG: SMC-Scp complex subunit ScpB, partial [Hyphomicrobiaceae bacterium]